jgi:hypothetical protein
MLKAKISSPTARDARGQIRHGISAGQEGCAAEIEFAIASQKREGCPETKWLKDQDAE